MTTAAIISTPTLFAFHESNTDQLAAGMPVVFVVTGQTITQDQHPDFKAAIDEWYASDCFMSQQHLVDIVVDADGAVTYILRWATKEAFLRDQGTQCEAFNLMMGQISQIGGSNMRMSATTSITSSPR
jgi:hypothetical protein